MIIQKNKITLSKYYSLLFTLIFLLSCGVQKNYLTRIEAKKIPIAGQNKEVAPIENFIKPYRERIDKDLNEILAYSPETLDKKQGKWQTNIGNLVADICFKSGNLVFKKRQNKEIDFCLLNHGGIRAILPKGNLTAKNAYQIMPFENSLYVVALSAEQINEMANYIITEAKPHPLSGMSFTIDKNHKPKNILIQGQPLQNDKIYYVATNDYLMNGGDNMNFFKKNQGTFDLEYKLRNILIDYLKQVDTIEVNKSVRIFEEQ